MKATNHTEKEERKKKLSLHEVASGDLEMTYNVLDIAFLSTRIILKKFNTEIENKQSSREIAVSIVQKFFS